MSVLRERLLARSRRRRSRSAERLFRKTPVFRNNGWLPGGWAFYYVRRLDPRLNPGEERYHRRVWLRRLGTAPHTDALVFGEGRGRTQFYSVAVTADGRWLAVRASPGTGRRSDVYLADLTAGPPERPLLYPVQEDLPAASRLHAVPGTGPQDALWLRTDHGAPRGRVVAVRPADLHLGPRAWREVIPERPDATLTHLTVLPGPGPGTPGPGTGSGLGLGSAPGLGLGSVPGPGGGPGPGPAPGPGGSDPAPGSGSTVGAGRSLAVVAWSCRAVAEVSVYDLADGTLLATAALPGTGAVGDFSPGPYGSYEAYFTYTGFVTPPRVLRIDARTGRVTRWHHPPRPARRAGGAHTRQVTFPSRDGTKVGMFVISPTGRPDVPRPLLLTGYGGFGQIMSPRYRVQVLAWVRAGGVFVWAGLRGGGEEGERWHLAGSGEHKQNTFDDFAAAADHLLAAGWSEPGRVAVMGTSNGGLLVGAALTQEPGKYAAVVCRAPLLDMVRYEGSGLGPSWVPEYGSAHDPGQLRTLLDYSPYHRVTPGTSYPAVLLTASDGDTRTDPLHARKMCAALQHATTGPAPVLLRLEHGVGHGARSVSRAIALEAECLAFLAHQVGLPAPRLL
ncbi:prolyl oligopeptidase family serine peptidase [Streptomyces sp. CFMR 7]|uniref:prolyl oligopeptidase family serine peptidase n=1 Tax=Streptomyces sp. CFMR 7 TaxID=1649184 RepID=UPI00099B7385|nr:prolyl oligopeptidase family serine peptidase [Streptomyces sp. CFMR 7]